jgi:hypothetical protein
MFRAAIVVLDFFDADPVAVTQSPTVMALTASVTLFENCVVDVQFTVVCPLPEFWTSMLDPLNAATLPEAPIGVFDVAAPAAAPDPSTPAAISAAALAPRTRAQLRRGRPQSVGVAMMVIASFVCRGVNLAAVSRISSYSLRKASIGASEAARLAG